MPIKGITGLQLFPRLGELRKGGPMPDDQPGPGRDLDHFRFVTTDEAAAALFQQAYGQRPTTINVLLPFATPEENFSAWRELWDSRTHRLAHRCDGETCVLWFDPARRTYRQDPIPCPGGCEPTGRLMVVIPELRRLAYVLVITNSVHDIRRIDGSLRALFALRGDLRGIPLLLRRQPEKVWVPAQGGERIRVDKWLLALEAHPRWVAQQLERSLLSPEPPEEASQAAPSGSEGPEERAPGLQAAEGQLEMPPQQSLPGPGPEPEAPEQPREDRPHEEQGAPEAQEPSRPQAPRLSREQYIQHYLSLLATARRLGLALPSTITLASPEQVRTAPTEQIVSQGRTLAALVRAEAARRSQGAENGKNSSPRQ